MLFCASFSPLDGLRQEVVVALYRAEIIAGCQVDNRLVVIYSKFDLGNGWEQFPHAYSYGLNDESALQIGSRVLVDATTH